MTVCFDCGGREGRHTATCKKKVFPYVIATEWLHAPVDAGLRIYSYGTQIQMGTMEDAEEFLAYVARQAGNEDANYRIFKVSYEEIKGI